MGMHSTFFVPAKYGRCPKFSTPSFFPKETVCSSRCRSGRHPRTVGGGLLSFYFRDDEYIIGLILMGLAVVGALASLLIRRMPPANANRIGRSTFTCRCG